MAPVTVRVPAKVNLQLSVGPCRPDGFHELVTVFHAVSLYDEVTAAPSPRLRVTVDGESSDAVPLDDSNLAVRAVRLLAAEVAVEPDVHLHIRKGIPVAGGMAGGSADAAGALLACDVLWGVGLPAERLRELAAELGSDVPFPLVGGTAIGTGRGERLTPALTRSRFHWVFALAEHGLSTPAVFKEYDRLVPHPPQPAVHEPLMAALRSGDADALGQALRNDLELPAISLYPRLRQVLDAGRAVGAYPVVSGSGATCAFLATSESHAVDVVAALTASGACRAVRRAVGPVPGARVVDRLPLGGLL